MYKYYCGKAQKGYEIEGCDFEYYVEKYCGRVYEMKQYVNEYERQRTYCPVCRCTIDEHAENIIYADIGGDEEDQY